MPWPWAVGRMRGAVGVTALAMVALVLLVTLSAAGGPTTGPSATSALALDDEPADSPSPAIAGAPTTRTLDSSPGPVSKPPPRVQVVADRGSFRISGTVATKAQAIAIEKKIVAAYGQEAVAVSLEVDPALSDAGAEQVADVVTALGDDATGVTVDLSGNRVALQGYVATEQVHEDVALAASAVVSDADDVDDAIRVVATATPTPTVDDDTEPMTTVSPPSGSGGVLSVTP